MVSDYQAVQELQSFGYADGQAQAARLALSAGVNIEMAVTSPSQYSTYANTGPQLLASHQLTMAQLNDAVRHVLTLKYLAGPFAQPSTDPTRVQNADLTPANLAAARNSADRSMVRLQNHNQALPLSTSLKSVAVVGPLANDPADQLGPDVPIGYDITQGKVVSVLDGIKTALPGANVTYAQGCDANCTSSSDFGAAIGAARDAAVTVVVRRRAISRSRRDRSTSGWATARSAACPRRSAPSSAGAIGHRQRVLRPIDDDGRCRLISTGARER